MNMKTLLLCGPLPALFFSLACSGTDHSLGSGSIASTGEDGGANPPSSGGAGSASGGTSNASGGAGNAPSSGGASTGTGGSTSEPDVCAEIATEVATLLHSHQQCEQDVDCQLEPTLVACPSPLCELAFNVATDIQALDQTVNDLSARYVAAGCTCPQAACAASNGARCNPDTGLCEPVAATCYEVHMQEWNDLVDKYNDCEQDQDCGYAFVSGADCVAHCGPIVNVTLDLTELQQEGPRLSQSVTDSCGVCIVADCAQPTGFICNAQSKCEAVY